MLGHTEPHNVNQDQLSLNTSLPGIACPCIFLFPCMLKQAHRGALDTENTWVFPQFRPLPRHKQGRHPVSPPSQAVFFQFEWIHDCLFGDYSGSGLGVSMPCSAIRCNTPAGRQWVGKPYHRNAASSASSKGPGAVSANRPFFQQRDPRPQKSWHQRRAGQGPKSPFQGQNGSRRCSEPMDGDPPGRLSEHL